MKTKISLDFLSNNLRNYMNEAPMIGFTQSFPETKEKPIAEEIFDDECRGIKVRFSVRLTKLKFGDNNEYECLGIVTDKIDISHKLPMGGWGSHCYYDEGKLLEAAVATMCVKHEVFVCNKICTWPFAKVVVSKITPAHQKAHIEKLLKDNK